MFCSAFTDPNTLITCTLLGTVSQHYLQFNPSDNTIQVHLRWTRDVECLAKVNALAVHGDWLAVGGFGKDKKGVVEIWYINYII